MLNNGQMFLFFSKEHIFMKCRQTCEIFCLNLVSCTCHVFSIISISWALKLWDTFWVVTKVLLHLFLLEDSDNVIIFVNADWLIVSPPPPPPPFPLIQSVPKELTVSTKSLIGWNNRLIVVQIASFTLYLAEASG